MHYQIATAGPYHYPCQMRYLLHKQLKFAIVFASVIAALAVTSAYSKHICTRVSKAISIVSCWGFEQYARLILWRGHEVKLMWEHEMFWFDTPERQHRHAVMFLRGGAQRIPSERNRPKLYT